MNIVINVLYIFLIMLALCLMLSMTHYAQNYAGKIGGSYYGPAYYAFIFTYYAIYAVVAGPCSKIHLLCTHQCQSPPTPGQAVGGDL